MQLGQPHRLARRQVGPRAALRRPRALGNQVALREFDFRTQVLVPDLQQHLAFGYGVALRYWKARNLARRSRRHLRPPAGVHSARAGVQHRLANLPGGHLGHPHFNAVLAARKQAERAHDHDRGNRDPDAVLDGRAHGCVSIAASAWERGRPALNPQVIFLSCPRASATPSPNPATTSAAAARAATCQAASNGRPTSRIRASPKWRRTRTPN